MADDATRPERRLTFAAGGWVLVLAGVLALAFLISVLIAARSGARSEAGRAAARSFDLSQTLVPIASITDSGVPRDRIAALNAPALISPEEVDALTISTRNKYLVPADRVVGLTIGAEARAYPLRVLVWHEVINDSIGGIPVAVTYNALSDTAAVFDRRVDGETLEFGVSGRLLNSTLLMFDRRPPGQVESLWSVLQRRALSGPAGQATHTLTLLPSRVLPWGEWRAAHPSTRAVKPDPEMSRKYQSDPYLSYFGSDLLRFPVDPLPPEGPRHLKSPLTIVRTPEGRLIDCDSSDPACQQQGEPVMQTLWFAWFSTR